MAYIIGSLETMPRLNITLKINRNEKQEGLAIQLRGPVQGFSLGYHSHRLEHLSEFHPLTIKGIKTLLQ
jgi:hypothetical protein